MYDDKNILPFLLTGTAGVSPPHPLCSPTKNSKILSPFPLQKKYYDYRRLKNTTYWSSSQTYTSITSGACEVNTSIKHANIGDLTHANTKIRKLKLEQNLMHLIHFPNLGSIQECMLVCDSDTPFANLWNSSSQGG